MGQSRERRRGNHDHPKSSIPRYRKQGKTEVCFNLSEGLTTLGAVGGKGSPLQVPKAHPCTMHSTGGQTMAVFSQADKVSDQCLTPTRGHTGDRNLHYKSSQQRITMATDEISLEGMVVHRAECRPVVNDNYMKLKKVQMKEAIKPQRLSQQLEKAITTIFKPVSNHDFNLEYEKKKKAEGRMVRAERQLVLDMLFSAFEKHQYYNIKDLVDITKQPVTYLKEIMREIGTYNSKGAHKSTWELKPEYRHYQPAAEEEEEEAAMETS
ncbi:general transcription factor IIF subunit 2-like isoform 2-T2 [Synchiropus picturatus]